MTISNIWVRKRQLDIYKATKKPNPEEALQMANLDMFHSNSAAYPWNNEEPADLCNIMNFQGKKALGVTASADQALVMCSLGLSDYLGFDISQIACYWAELKIASIKKLSFQEFIYFTQKEHIPSQKVKRNLYPTIRDYLSVYAQHFFDKWIENDSVFNLTNDNRYFRGNEHKFDITKVPYCQNEKKYLMLKEFLLEKFTMKLMWLSINEALAVTSNEKFDVIFISNILDRWKIFGNDYTSILKKMQVRLKNEESRVIGHYDSEIFCGTLGHSIVRHIKEAACKTNLVYTDHCPNAHNYWTLQLHKS